MMSSFYGTNFNYIIMAALLQQNSIARKDTSVIGNILLQSVNNSPLQASCRSRLMNGIQGYGVADILNNEIHCHKYSFPSRLAPFSLISHLNETFNHLKLYKPSLMLITRLGQPMRF